MLARFLPKLIAATIAVFTLSLSAQPLLVAAAADLAPLEAQLNQGFIAAGGEPLRFTFGSSGMLAHQIENGAPFDVFLSANEQFVQELAAQGKLIAGSTAAYATGRIAIWSAHQTVPNLEALTNSTFRLIAIPNPEHAPYGVAARALLQDAKLWSRLQPKIVLAENVRQAFEYAATGNADAVITAWSLLREKPGAKLLPAEGHLPIRQSGGVVSGTRRETQGRAFVRFLLSPAGQSILRAGGLFPPATGQR